MARSNNIANSASTTPIRKSQRSSAATPLSTPISSTREKRRSNATSPKYTEALSASESEDLVPAAKPQKPVSRKRKVKPGSDDDSDFDALDVAPDEDLLDQAEPSLTKTPAKKSPATKNKRIKIETVQVKTEQPKASTKKSKPTSRPNGTTVTTPKPKPKAKRKTKEEKEAEKMPLAARTLNTKLFIGAHVSAAGGVHNSVTNSVHIGGNAFALFLKSQRKWDNPPIKPEHAQEFKHLCSSHSYNAHSHIVPHGSYLVNLASPDPEKGAQAYKGFLDDIQRAESLDIKLYNFHPGNTNGEPRAEAIARIAAHLNAAHKATSSVVTLLENMAASPAGNAIGGQFEDLRDVIALVDDKARVGVCLDTCHAFAAGYDLRTPSAFKAVLAAFDRTIGLPYLRAVHLNDSKAPLGAHRDLHQNIGLGFLGLRAFHTLVNDPVFAGLPLVLETPIDRKDDAGKDVEDKSVWAREIKLLESLVGMDASSDEFKRLEAELALRGAEERKKYQEQFDRKMDKAARTPTKTKKKKKKKGKVSSDDDDQSE